MPLIEVKLYDRRVTALILASGIGPAQRELVTTGLERLEVRWHDVDIEPGTRLAGVLGAAPVHANSRHHQAVTSTRVAPGLVAAGTTPDGIVEALEDPSKRWVISVQWHPERAEMGDASAPLFEAFVRACRGDA